MIHDEKTARHSISVSDTTLDMIGTLANQLEFSQSLVRATFHDSELGKLEQARDELAAVAVQLETARARVVRVLTVLREGRDPADPGRPS